MEAIPVQIESFISTGLPKHTVVGLPGGAVRESLDRISAALRSSRIPVPRGAITVNLAPADVRKESAAFDLPVALSLLSADASRNWALNPNDLVVMGELALDGRVRPVRGVLSMALRAVRDGRYGIIVPEENVPEARLVREINVFGVAHLKEAVLVLAGKRNTSQSNPELRNDSGQESIAGDFADIVGNEEAKRSLEIAAVGRHHVLLTGPPGCGKTILSRRLPGIMPRLTHAESMEVTRIHSLSLDVSPGTLIDRPPFRAPHHSISHAGLIGGGRALRAGEMTIAHHGVLFLDELPEFSRNTLEAMRQPMEDGRIILTRANDRVSYPCRFMLVAAMNPCPCGLWGSRMACRCAPPVRKRYAARISGPLLDRIDLFVHVRREVNKSPLVQSTITKTSESILSGVSNARSFAANRRRLEKRGTSRMQTATSFPIHAHQLTPSAVILLEEASRTLGLSLRGMFRTLAVSRSIADLALEEKISDESVSEALMFRETANVGRELSPIGHYLE